MAGKPTSKVNYQHLIITLFLGLLGFSIFLMFHTFSYDQKTHAIKIASKLWSDFGAHLPLIRSFSYGDNFNKLWQGKPIESPLFPNEPIRYHFGFYAFVGLLEKLGVPLDWALNVPSALGFFVLMVLIYAVAAKLFTDRRAGFLSVLFLLFNGSLSFLKFFEKHPPSITTFYNIVTNSRFPSFGPWDGGPITAFWSLNIYTNQRHLAFSYTLVLAIIAVFVFVIPGQTRNPLFANKFIQGVLIAAASIILLFTNFPAAAITGLFLVWIFLIKREVRPTLVIAALLILPPAFWLIKLVNLARPIHFDPGWLTPKPLTILSFFHFWFANIGLHILLIPLGILLSPKSARKLLAPLLFVLFILPNLFRFSPDPINNHKFFNFFLIIGNMFSAYAVIRILQQLKKPLQVVVGIGLIGFLTLSGLIDFFPILNDTRGSLPDLPDNPDVVFFKENTAPDATILNSTWFYHPASLAGRSIFSGYTYFTWSYGYDQAGREEIVKAIYQAPTKEIACNLLLMYHIGYVELNDRPEMYLSPNWELWRNEFVPIYHNFSSGLRVYKVSQNCFNQKVVILNNLTI